MSETTPRESAGLALHAAELGGHLCASVPAWQLKRLLADHDEVCAKRDALRARARVVVEAARAWPECDGCPADEYASPQCPRCVFAVALDEYDKGET